MYLVHYPAFRLEMNGIASIFVSAYRHDYLERASGRTAAAAIVLAV